MVHKGIYICNTGVGLVGATTLAIVSRFVSTQRQKGAWIMNTASGKEQEVHRYWGI